MTVLYTEFNMYRCLKWNSKTTKNNNITNQI